jgi:nucleoside 2-deoxyribosyltransferase
MNKLTSPLTGIQVDGSREARNDTSYYHDPICGSYAVPFDSPIKSLTPGQKHQLAKVLATKILRFGEGTPVSITENRTGMNGAWECIPASQLLSQYPSDVPVILDEALLNMSKMISFPSEKIEVNDQTRWLIYAHDKDSERYIIRQLEELHYIQVAEQKSGPTYMICSYTIEAPGWKRIQEIGDVNPSSKQAFVAMWFSDEMANTYSEAIEPAVSDCGFAPLRIDLKEHNNKICDEIIAEIRKSRFLVADFSGNRGGVYYEAGFAHGLGIPVIWTVRKQDLDDVHFDTRQFNHIDYDTTDELRDRLTARIRATITNV